MAEKKILLFIVEGRSDETALAPALEKIVTAHNVKFKVMRTDITSDFASNENNIERRIKEQAVKKFLKANPQFSSKDICGLVHITDLDGVFINDDFVKETATDDPVYKNTCIECKDREMFLKSQNNKKKNLLHLISIREIVIPEGVIVPYAIYFMSCNLDHVLHDERNLTEDEKKDKSLDFADKYDEPLEFKEFFNKEDVKIDGSYLGTWNDIQNDLNSLKKGSNFWICIDQYYNS